MADRRFTYDDLRALPSDVKGELIDGKLAVTRHSAAHARAASTLGAVLGGLSGPDHHAPRGWIIREEPEFHIGDDVLVPDLAGWRADREPSFERRIVSMPPDWICEVITPETEAIDRSAKTAIYARAGVTTVWMLGARAHTLDVFALAGATYARVATHGGQETVRLPPFVERELDLGDFWIRLDAVAST